jgi:heme-degrading monooxygenase HmoA
MPSVVVRIAFEDFEKWKAGFEAAGGMRQAYGSKGVRALRNLEKPDEVVIVGEYEDLERARQLFQSQEFREATQRAGLTRPPEVTFHEEVLSLPA